MKRQVKTLGLVLIVGIFVPCSSHGSISALMNAKRFVDEAVLVCKGEVEAISDGGISKVLVGRKLIEMNRAIASFRVDRLIKGSVNSHTIEIDFFVLRQGVGPFWDSLQEGDYCLSKKVGQWAVWLS